MVLFFFWYFFLSFTGKILSCKLVAGRGHAFVHFESQEAADGAIAGVNGKVLIGQKVGHNFLKGKKRKTWLMVGGHQSSRSLSLTLCPFIYLYPSLLRVHRCTWRVSSPAKFVGNKLSTWLPYDAYLFFFVSSFFFLAGARGAGRDAQVHQRLCQESGA